MKRVAIADIHLTAYKDDPIGEDGLPYRLGMIIKVLRSICKFCQKNKIKYIDILGDLYNDKDLIYTDSINAFKNVLLDFSDIEFTILSGNHDMSSIGEHQTSAVMPLVAYPNVNVIDQVSKDVCVNVVAVPWTKDIGDKVKIAKSAPILLSHFGLSEAQLSSGISMTTSIKLTDLAKYKLVILGHYHKPQDLQNDKTRLFYTGNLIHINWNDKNENKRFLVYDTETLEVKSIPIKGFKEYREYIIDDKDKIAAIMNEAMDAKSQGHNVRVRKLIKEKVEASEDMVVLEESVIDPTNRGITVSMSTADKMQKYVEIKDIPPEEVDDYIKVGNSIVS